MVQARLANACPVTATSSAGSSPQDMRYMTLLASMTPADYSQISIPGVSLRSSAIWPGKFFFVEREQKICALGPRTIRVPETTHRFR